MKRNITILIVVIGMLLISSCNNVKESDKKEEPTKIEEQIIDYDTVFESVSLKDYETFSMKRITLDGAVIQILDNDRILLNKDSNLTIYDTKLDKETILVENMWNPTVSKDKKIIAYENNEGIHIIQMKDQTSKLIYKLNGEVSKNFIISSNNKSILLQTIQDNEFHTKIVDLEGKVKEVPLNENDDFVITRLLHFSDDQLFALVEIKKERIPVSEQELLKTSDLIMMNINTNKVKNLTDMSAEDQTYVLDQYKDELLIQMIQYTFNDDGITSESSIKKVNMNNGVLYNTNIILENATVLKVLSDESEYVWLEQPVETNSKYPNEKEIKLKNKNGKQTIGTISTDIPLDLFIQGNKLIFKSNGDLYTINLMGE